MSAKPSNAFIGASWMAMGAGTLGYLIGLYRAQMQLVATILSIILLTVGLWNATILPSEKGFYAFSFLLAIFGALAVQKNTRDTLQAEKSERSDKSERADRKDPS